MTSARRGGVREIIGVMKRRFDNEWKAIIVLGCDHAGLRPEFQLLEDEFVRAVNACHTPRDMMHYLREIRVASKLWREVHNAREREK